MVAASCSCHHCWKLSFITKLTILLDIGMLFAVSSHIISFILQPLLLYNMLCFCSRNCYSSHSLCTLISFRKKCQKYLWACIYSKNSSYKILFVDTLTVEFKPYWTVLTFLSHRSSSASKQLSIRNLNYLIAHVLVEFFKLLTSLPWASITCNSESIPSILNTLLEHYSKRVSFGGLFSFHQCRLCENFHYHNQISVPFSTSHKCL